jgi:Gas vesicle synthesis protein GvpL/GvpF
MANRMKQNGRERKKPTLKLVERSQPRANDAENVLYLYGITKASSVSPIEQVVGIDGEAPVETIVGSGLACWISRVSRLDYADRLGQNMEKLEWLADVSVRHQRVVAAIGKERDVLPARFGTVFLSEASLLADLRERRRELETDLKRIQGSDEWGVKVFSMLNRAKPPMPSQSGKDYLQKKAALLRARSSKPPDPEVLAFASELKRIAAEVAMGGKISAGQRNLEWQGSLLLRRSGRKKLEALLKKFSRQWEETRQIECTGPWPPYSFVSSGKRRSEASGIS